MIYLLTPIYSLFVLMVDIVEFVWSSYWDILWTCLYTIIDKPQKSIKGKTVLVTGAASGVGKELAGIFAKEGCNVVCWDIDEDRNQATVEHVRSLGTQGQFAANKVDVSIYEEVIAAANKVRREFGTVDILVNNAGIMPTKLLLSHSPEEIQKIFSVNVLSQFWTLRAFLPDMYGRGTGCVVSLSSNCGLMGSPNLVPYCASKHAVRGLMEALHEEERHMSQDRKPVVHYLTVFPFIINTQLVKYPRVRFPWLTPVLTPKYVAEEIVKALKQKEEVLFFPKWMYFGFLFSRLWPRRMQQRFYDLLDVGVDERQYNMIDGMRLFNQR